MGARSVSPEPERFSLTLGDGAVAGWRFAREGAARILFCQANGFCASAYKQMLALLAPDFDVFAVDLRGHGRTSLPADPRKLRDWRVYARDIAAFMDHPAMREGPPWILAGHSCGAVSATLAADGRNDVLRLALIEPVAPPPHLSFLAGSPLWPALAGRTPLAQNARMRRRFWSTREEAQEGYARKAFFKAWSPGVLGDYLEDGLTDAESGVGLACKPEWEAASFIAQAHNFWAALARVPGPVSVLAADHPGTTLFPGAARRLKKLGVRLKMHRGAGHLIPMEAPAASAAFILDPLR